MTIILAELHTERTHILYTKCMLTADEETIGVETFFQFPHASELITFCITSYSIILKLYGTSQPCNQLKPKPPMLILQLVAKFLLQYRTLRRFPIPRLFVTLYLL